MNFCKDCRHASNNKRNPGAWRCCHPSSGDQEIDFVTGMVRWPLCREVRDGASECALWQARPSLGYRILDWLGIR